MVFSSLPLYLDSPNWQQQPNQHLGARNETHQLRPLPPPVHDVGGGGGGTGPIRHGSMADRARLAKLPQPEAALKCPRCESTNTKFCYFNNYSLSQPRHFCKTCRRYWTRGGALRNVPVGGGCRRNKKSKNQSRSKSPVSCDRQLIGSNSSSTNNGIPSEINIGHHLPQQQPITQPFMTSSNFMQFGVGNVGLNFGGTQGVHMGATSDASAQASTAADMGFQMGSNPGMNSSSAILSGGGGQQFPFFELPPVSLFPFQSEGIEAASSMIGENQPIRSMTSSSRVSQLSPVKFEENQALNLSKLVLGISENNQYWSGNTWTDLSGLNSSSTSHIL